MVDEANSSQYPCRQCGANVAYTPGEGVLSCPYCGYEEEVAPPEGVVEELDFTEGAALEASEGEQESQATVQCETCGAITIFDGAKHSGLCAFCATPLVAHPGQTRVILPRSLLPFRIDHDDALARFRRWVQSRWLAPNLLKKVANTEGRLDGMYVPYWTYDSRTETRYQGQRGDDYYETQHYTAHENGKAVQKTRQVRKTRWRSVQGTVSRAFDDVLILASHSLPSAYADKLEPWDLENLEPYQPDYLSGFQAEVYQVGLVEGFDCAKMVMKEAIRQDICHDIGGDHQRISFVQTRYDDVTYKHILLPVWVSAYRFKQKLYRILVNARTGEVQGERPWSWVKIALLVVLGLFLLGMLAFAWGEARGTIHSYAPMTPPNHIVRTFSDS